MRILVRLICLCATLFAASAFAYNLYAYFLFKAVNADSENLYTYVDNHTKSFELKRINGYGDRMITSNSVLDTINATLEPFTNYSGVRNYDTDREHIHKLENRFSVQELSILSKTRVLSRILPANSSHKLKPVEYLYDNQPFDYPDFLRDKALNSIVSCFLVLIGWITISVIAFRGTNYHQFNSDYIFIRYAWANESALVGRKLISLVFNAILLAALTVTVVLPFSIEIYQYSSEVSDNVLALLSLCAFGLFALWSLTSIGWWIFGSKKPAA